MSIFVCVNHLKHLIIIQRKVTRIQLGELHSCLGRELQYSNSQDTGDLKGRADRAGGRLCSPIILRH